MHLHCRSCHLGGGYRYPPSAYGTSSQSPQSAKQTNCSKGKELVQSTLKRAREVNEAEPSRKMLSQGPHVLDSIGLREVAPKTSQALSFWASQGKSSFCPSSCTGTREGFQLPESRQELEILAQEIQRACPPITNLKL